MMRGGTEHRSPPIEGHTQRMAKHPGNGRRPKPCGFAEAFSDHLAANGLSQARVADALGVSQGMVSYWCSGRSIPEPEKVFALEVLLFGASSGQLSRHLGYVPAEPAGERLGVEEAIATDKHLSKSGKRTLLEVYRAVARYGYEAARQR